MRCCSVTRWTKEIYTHKNLLFPLGLILSNLCYRSAGSGSATGSGSTTGFAELTFDVEPRDVIAIKDQPLQLDCSVRSSVGVIAEPSSRSQSNVVIDWIKDGSAIKYDDRRFKLQNGSLYFANGDNTRLFRPDEGMYQCKARVQSLGIIVSRKARIQLAFLDRTFSDEPKSTSVHLGDVVMFPCRLDGLPRPSVKWFKDDTELDLQNTNYFVHVDSLLEIRNVQFSDFGKYKCKASNEERTKFSRIAQLTQDSNVSTYQGVLPHFILKPKDTVAVEGSTIVLHCGANGRDRNGAQPRLVWLRDGTSIDLSNAESRLSLEGQSSLRIDGLQEEDAGSYTCRAVNQEDSVDADALITVQVPPKFRWRPKGISSFTNTDVELECDIYGNPKPTIEWLKNGEVVVSSHYFQIINGRNLRILGLMKTDEGMYQCTASNAVGMIQSSAWLKVIQKDQTTSSPGLSVPSKTRSTLLLSTGVPTQTSGDTRQPSAPMHVAATYVSTHFITLSWQPPQDIGTEEEILGYSIYWKESSSMRERVLNTSALESTIQHLKPSSKYLFRVAAYTDQTLGKESTEVTVQTQTEDIVPVPAAGLKATPVSATSIRVAWQRVPDLGNPIDHYSVYFYDVKDLSASELEQTTTGNELTVVDLCKFCEYRFRVVAYNKNGPGISSDEISCRTHSDVPSSAPHNVSVEAISSTSVAMTWDPPPENSQNGIITGYKIRYKLKQKAERSVETVTTDGSHRSLEVTNLEKGTEYSFRVLALTVNGSGPPSPWLSAETFVHDLDESTVPGQPTSLRVRPLISSIVVSWTPPIEQDIMIRGYVLGYGIGVPDVFRQILDARQRYHTIKSLKPSSEYVISLKAFNSMGEGVPIYETTVTREESTPEPVTPLIPPVGLKATVLSSTTILLTWSDSTLPGRGQHVTDNRYYTVRYMPKMLQTKNKYRMVNATSLSQHIEDLKPDTEYEFNVKVTKGPRLSTWSLSVFNKTKEAVPTTAPRDLTPFAIEGKPTFVALNWQPPRQTNGQVTGYLIYYTTDSTQQDNEWVAEGVLGDRLTTTIRDLTPETTYYFKVQARNSVGYGPLSPTIIFRTPKTDGTGGGLIETPDDFGSFTKNSQYKWYLENAESSKHSTDAPGSTNNGVPSLVLWIVIACICGVILIFIGVIVTLVRHRKVNKAKEKRRNKIEENQKYGQKDLVPPDLCRNHENVELTSLDRDNSDDEDDVNCGAIRRTHMLQSPVLPSPGLLKSYEDEHTQSLSRHKNPYMIPVDQPLSYREQPIGRAIQNCINYDGSIPRSPTTSAPRVNAGDYTQPTPAKPMKPLCTSSSAKKPSLLLPNLSSQLQQSKPPSHGYQPPQLNTTGHPMEAGHASVSDQNRFSTAELAAEMENLDGLMKDLTSITQQQFGC